MLIFMMRGFLALLLLGAVVSSVALRAEGIQTPVNLVLDSRLLVCLHSDFKDFLEALEEK